MAHPIFDIPDILRLIFEQLRGSKLAPLLLVSRRFFLCAFPLVWESIDGPGKLFGLLFPKMKMKKINDGWINNIRPARGQPLERFKLYAPYIREVHHMVGWSRQEVSWTVILRAVSMRPLLPNLQSLTLSDEMQSTPTIHLLSALVCPTLFNIRAPGLDRSNGSFRSVLSPQLMTRIVKSCPNICCLELYSRASRYHPRGTSIPGTRISTNLFASLGQLHSLCTLGAGPEALSYGMLRGLGSLPNLESLMISIPPDTPEQMIPSQIPPLPNRFLALRHLSWYCESPAVTSHLWKTLCFVRQLTSASIQVGYKPNTHNNIIDDLVNSVCRFSPNLTTLHLDFNSENSMLELDLFKPTTMDHFSRLPLQRMRVLTSRTTLLPPDNYEKFTLALSDMEYLDIQGCYFTYQGIECVAQHMPKLQFLAVSLVSSSWPSKEELPLAPSFSPSILCLKSKFTADVWYTSRGSDRKYIDSMSTALSRLWPNGVRCIFSDIIADGVCRQDRDALKLINARIKRLCSPNGLSTADMYAKSQWRYDFCDASWFQMHRYY